MHDDRFKKDMERRFERWNRKKSKGRVWTGLLLLLVGVLLFIKTANLAFFPFWFFTWPTLLIVIGLFSGLKHRFRGGFWIILVVIGGLSLANDIKPSMHLDRYEWPIFFTALGLVFILRPRHRRCRRWQGIPGEGEERATDDNVDPGAQDSATAQGMDRRDFVDITAVFAGVKKNVLSKDFKGGDIVSFMGGSELDLTQADFTGRIKMDLTNIFGGTKLIVPPTWDVQSEVTAIFGGVDDKRQLNGGRVDREKLLILDGTCIFGGIEIRSF